MSCACKIIVDYISPPLQEKILHQNLYWLLEKSVYYIFKPIMYGTHCVINIPEGFLINYKPYNLLNYIPNIAEGYIATGQKEKYFIDYFYGTISNRSMTSEHHPLGSTNDTQPKLRIDSLNNNLTPTRDRKKLSVIAESMGSNTNGSEYSMSSSSGIIDTLQENSGGSSQVNEDGENRYQKLMIANIKLKKAKATKQLLEADIEENNLKKIKAKKLASPSPLRQETSSTRSGVTSRPASVSRLDLSILQSTKSTSSNQLSQSLSAFPNDEPTSSSHQNSHQDKYYSKLSAHHNLNSPENR